MHANSILEGIIMQIGCGTFVFLSCRNKRTTTVRGGGSHRTFVRTPSRKLETFVRRSGRHIAHLTSYIIKLDIPIDSEFQEFWKQFSFMAGKYLCQIVARGSLRKLFGFWTVPLSFHDKLNAISFLKNSEYFVWKNVSLHLWQGNLWKKFMQNVFAICLVLPEYLSFWKTCSTFSN